MNEFVFLEIKWGRRGTKTDIYHTGLCNVGPKADFFHSALSIVT